MMAVCSAKVAEDTECLPQAHFLAVQGAFGWVLALGKFRLPGQVQQLLPQLPSDLTCRQYVPKIPAHSYRPGHKLNEQFEAPQPSALGSERNLLEGSPAFMPY